MVTSIRSCLNARKSAGPGLDSARGATGADAGRGLALRMDHGTQYTADDFLNQVKF